MSRKIPFRINQPEDLVERFEAAIAAHGISRTAGVERILRWWVSAPAVVQQMVLGTLAGVVSQTAARQIATQLAERSGTLQSYADAYEGMRAADRRGSRPRREDTRSTAARGSA